MEVGERYQGALLGLALGDALTTTLEVKRRGTFAPVMVGRNLIGSPVARDLAVAEGKVGSPGGPCGDGKG